MIITEETMREQADLLAEAGPDDGLRGVGVEDPDVALATIEKVWGSSMPGLILGRSGIAALLALGARLERLDNDNTETTNG